MNKIIIINNMKKSEKELFYCKKGQDLADRIESDGKIHIDLGVSDVLKIRSSECFNGEFEGVEITLPIFTSFKFNPNGDIISFNKTNDSISIKMSKKNWEWVLKIENNGFDDDIIIEVSDY